jgi:hypothetical protein
MISINIVVETPPSVPLLRRLLDGTNCSCRFFAGERRTSPSELGQSVLVHEGGPVLVVIDGETLSPRKAAEERDMARGLMQLISTPDYCDAFVFVPGLEVIFFEAPGVLIRHFGADQIKESVIERGHYLPDDTLAKVLSTSGRSKEEFFKSLGSEDLEELRQGPQARKLIAAVEKLAASAERFEGAAVTSP